MKSGQEKAYPLLCVGQRLDSGGGGLPLEPAELRRSRRY